MTASGNQSGKTMQHVALTAVVCLMLLGGCAQSGPSEAAEPQRAETAGDIPLPVPKPASTDDVQIALATPETPVVTESHVGLASWYGRRFHGGLTASGSLFDMAALTAAHPTLSFGSRVRVTNLANDRSVVVTITDRGPYVKSRIIDLSRAAAEQLGFLNDGLARVRLDVLADSAS